MHLTGLIEFFADLLPRRVKRAIGLLLAIGLMTGIATPLVMWFVETKSHEMTSDLLPAVEHLLPTPMVSP